ncbi:MAG: glycosyltransferase family 87 protein [Cytophagales bacterium]|nr:glycosyltransferase family 87 protein [Cytophagales bacterium]
MELRQYFSLSRISLTAIGGLYVLLAVFAAIQAVLLGENLIENGIYTHYNNYVIFKYSFFHLLEGKDLYIFHPSDHFDLYKYSPTFALLFGVFAPFPDVIGLSLWNLANAMAIYWGIRRADFFSEGAQKSVLLFAAIEMLTSLQNSQSNALIAGLFIWAFIWLEKRQYTWATLAILLTGFIKIFGVALFAICIFYPQKWKIILYSLLWGIVLLLLPLPFTGWEYLLSLYKSWWELLKNDYSISYGLSVMGWLASWFGWEPPKNAVVLAGLLVLLLPLMRIRAYEELPFRLAFFASLLCWVVIFNHKAESPTFIIPVAGLAMWYFRQEKAPLAVTILMVAVFVLTSLSPTDLFPRSLRDEVVIPYVLKAVPCIFLWIALQWEMMFPISDFRLRI